MGTFGASLRISDLFANLLGFQTLSQFGVQDPLSDAGTVDYAGPSPVAGCEAYLNALPPHAASSVAFVKENLAVVPDKWDHGGVASHFLNIAGAESSFDKCVKHIKSSDFIAFNVAFLDVIGPDAKLETIHTFSGADAKHVHEAPIYLPDTNEVLVSDTAIAGWMHAVNLDTHAHRKITITPPLANINGGTRQGSTLYLTTNGSPSRGIHTCTFTSSDHLTCTTLVNNYRMAHLNSPNDLIFDSRGSLLFTDPPYGWFQDWPSVQPPEVHPAIYHFDTSTKALRPLSNRDVAMPNGLAFSPDEKTLYVADSNSTSGKPMQFSMGSVRNVVAFDYSADPPGLRNPRLVYVCEAGWPDGLRVTTNGLLMVASMGGMDVVDVERGGLLLGKVNVGDDIVFNLEPAGNESGVWILTGMKGVYKATIAERSVKRPGF